MEKQFCIRFSEDKQVYAVDFYNPSYEDAIHICDSYKECVDYLRSLPEPPVHIVINSNINKNN